MKKISTILVALCTVGILQAQNAKQFWSPIQEKEITPLGNRVIVPQKYKTFHLVNDNLKNVLFSAPNENAVALKNSSTIIELPMPNGTMQKFRVVEAPVMAPELAAQFPSIKTFNVLGVDDASASGKLDWTEMGFHAMIRSISGEIYMDPYCRNNTTDYTTYYTSDFVKDPSKSIAEVGVVNSKKAIKKKESTYNANKTAATPLFVGPTLRKYRLAVSCTGEYAVAATGQASPTVAQTLSAIVTTVNRVDGVYETDLAIRMVLVATETVAIFTNASTDPYSGNNDGTILIDESQTVIDSTIGDANYDVGHTFSTGGGGLSDLGVVCQSGYKASSITGGPQPVGDKYDIDYVAHEVGHAFGGNHTFRAVTGSCSGNQNPGTMVEPGSGVTIMAYAGICSPNDDSTHSIPYFHTISFDEMVYYTNVDAGNDCPVDIASGNHTPIVNTGTVTYNVPKSTPFSLTGSATDPDGDLLSYSWEEIDNNSTGGNWNDGKAPYFRSYNPKSTSTRMFPKLSVVLSGTYTTTIGEFVPATTQKLNFRLVARDNKMGGGGVGYASATVSVTTTGPFSITYPNATGVTWAGASSQTITWNVNGTDAAPVSCSTVNILISYDGGNTFSTLMNGVTNSGTQLVTVPTVSTTISTCRIRVESVGNIFFDINDKNFTITSTTGIANVAGSNNMAMQLIPNPANEQVQINLFDLNRNSSNTITIYDVIGNVVLKDVVSGKENYELKYDVSLFSQGVYIVEIIGADKKGISRLVKQ